MLIFAATLGSLGGLPLLGQALGILPETESAVLVSHPKAHINYIRGLMLVYEENWQEALKAFKRAEKYDPDSAMIAFQIGRIHMATGDLGEGLAALNKAAELDEANFEIRRMLAEIYFKMGGFEEARSHAEDGLRLDPNWTEGYQLLAAIYQEEGKPLEAAAALERLLERFPASSHAHLSAAQLYLQTGRSKQALPHFLKVRELTGTNPQLELTIAGTYLTSGRYKEAIESYKVYLNDHPDVQMANGSLLAAYKNAEQLPDALTYFQERVDADRDDITAWFFLGQAYLLSEESDRAIETWNEATRLVQESDPNAKSKLLRFYYELASAYESQDRYDEAISTMQKAAALPLVNVSEILPVRSQLGTLLRLRKDYAGAAENFLALLQAIESLDEADRISDLMKGITKATHYELAATYDLMGQDDKVEPQLRAALDIDPAFAQANNYLAYFFAERGENLEEALGLVQRALEKEHSKAAFVDTLGWIYYKLGRLEEAREKLEEANSKADDPVIADHLGDVYRTLGDMGKALELWKRSVELARLRMQEDSPEDTDPSYDPEEVEKKIQAAIDGR